MWVLSFFPFFFVFFSLVCSFLIFSKHMNSSDLIIDQSRSDECSCRSSQENYFDPLPEVFFLVMLD